MAEDKTDSLLKLIEEHLARRPGMQPRDVYKLLFQSVRGPEHLLASPQAFSQRLSVEWEELDYSGDETLYESIRPDGSLLRLNLRPFKAVGGSLQALTEACLETGRRAWGTQSDLEKTWNDLLTGWQERSSPGMSLADLVLFTRWLESQSFPAVHHSEQYRSLYRPAYRLVAVGLNLTAGRIRQ